QFADYSDLEFEYPSNWHLLTIDYERTLAAAVGTVDKAGSCQVGATQEPECALKVRLEPIQVLVVIGRESVGAGTIFDVRPQGGWIDQIDGMPAWRGEPILPPGSNADGGERWLIAMPFDVSSVYAVDAIFRGPNVPILRSQVEALVRGITF